MNSIIEGNATYKITSNSGVTDAGYVEMSYDGDKMDIAHANKDSIVMMQLDNDDIMNILARPAHSMTLDERIRMDYPTNHYRDTSTRRITTARPSTRRTTTARPSTRRTTTARPSTRRTTTARPSTRRKLY